MKQERIETVPTRVQRALGGHAAIGLIAGALLYIIALSGMLVVVHERWQRWEQPAMPEMTTIAPQAAARAAAAGFAKDAGKPRTTHLYVHMPTDALPRTVVTTDHGAVYVDADGRIAGPEAHGWTEFLIGLHEYLHMPMTIGLIVGGALGVMLAALAITGVVAHPRILRDAFRMRVRGDRQIAQADWHNRLGVWTLPFVVTLGLTGAFVGLAAVNTTILARAYHGGDIERVYAPIFGAEGRVDARPAPVGGVAAALATMQARFPETRSTYVTIEDPGTRGARISILADHPRRLIFGETYRFDGAGRYQDRLGLSDGTLGQQIAASAYRLHFGSYGGLAVELAYIAFGLALCVVTATGMALWLQKRRRRGHASPRLEAFWSIIVWGSPILIVALVWLRAAGGAALPFGSLFWIGLAVLSVAGMAMPGRADPLWLRRVLAGMIALTAIGHLAGAAPYHGAVIAIDGGLLLVALAIMLAGGRRPDPATAAGHRATNAPAALTRVLPTP